MLLGAPVVEFHTGRYAHAEGEAQTAELAAHRRRRRARGQERHRAPCRPRPHLRQCPADRRHPADRRAQHRPFPDRRGDLHRPRRQRPADARADGRGAGMSEDPHPCGEGDLSRKRVEGWRCVPRPRRPPPPACGRGPPSPSGRGSIDHRPRLRPLQHRADPEFARPLRRALRASASSPTPSAPRRSAARSPAPAPTPSASPPRRLSPRRSAPASSAASS